MYDWLITHAQILDGSGGAAFCGNVGLSRGKIATLDAAVDAPARQRLDARNRTLTPGLIDVHRHADVAVFRPEFGRAELKQGLTTIVNGNCGMSPAPISGPHRAEIARYLAPVIGEAPKEQQFGEFRNYMAALQALPLPLHMGSLVGMGVLRANAAGFSADPLTSEQIQKIQRLLERALADGALGVSLGLGYAPECFSTTEELIRVLAPLQGTGTVITVHLRQEGDGVTEALGEMLQVARHLHTPVEISHLKGIGHRNWGRSVPEMLRLLTRARDDGLEVSCDVYPYCAGSTQLIHVLPPEFQSGGSAVLTARLRDPESRAAMRQRMETGTDFENITLLMGFENVLATGLCRPENQVLEGKSLAEIGKIREADPFDALFDLLAEEACGPSMIDFIASEEDIAAILQAPFSSVISDAIYPSAGQLHPRVYGMTARLLETFVKKKGTLSLPEGIRKLTRLPADRFGLSHKGRIEVGADADLCLFDPTRIREMATYSEPGKYTRGFDWVFVGGQPALAGGNFTDVFTGTVLRR